MEKKSRREREKQNRREEILNAAWSVFSLKEYGKATVDEIAEAAGLSKGTVYLYFNNKADLFLSTIEMGIEKAASIIQEVISSIDDPIESLKEIVKRMFIFFEENFGFFEILSSGRSHFEVHADTEDSIDFRNRIIEISSYGIKIMAEHIQRGIEAGAFRKVDPFDAALCLLEVIRGFAFVQIMMPVKLSNKSESIASIFLDGIRNKDVGC